MLNTDTNRDKIILAALNLAETQGWHRISLGDIATASGIPLIDLSRQFKTKADILAAFSREVDKAVLRQFPALTQDAPRDRLFDIVITRLEVMQPFKPALRRIREDLKGDVSTFLRQLAPALRSQYWMLEAAGINSEGGVGALRIQGLLAIYSRVFDIWLEDDDVGMARTMASLDSQLRRAESAMRRLQGAYGGFFHFVRAFRRSSKPDQSQSRSNFGSPSQPSSQA